MDASTPTNPFELVQGRKEEVAEQKPAICECLIATELVAARSTEDCLQELDDTCAACLVEQGDDMPCEPELRSEALAFVGRCGACSGGMHPTTAEQCTMVRDTALVPPAIDDEVSTSLCRECPAEFGSCADNLGCVAIVECCVEASTLAQECVLDPDGNKGPCSELYLQIGARNQPATRTAFDLAFCAGQTSCLSQ